MEKTYRSDTSIAGVFGKAYMNSGEFGLNQGYVYERALEPEESKFVNRVLEEHSIGEKVHETILEEGLDYLAECAQRGENIEEKKLKATLRCLISSNKQGNVDEETIYNVMDQAYSKRYGWSTDYQFRVMDAVKQGKEILKNRLEGIKQ